MAETERVIVTGSNIPTAAEVGPNPVDTYRRDDITRLGVRTPTDLLQKFPSVSGAVSTENDNEATTGEVNISLRGIDPKETLVLQDGRRVATTGTGNPAVDLKIFPLGLIDHIDVLKDGASPVYGTDAVGGVLNVFLIHRFRGMELYASYGNANLGFANDMGEETAYLLAGAGDDKTNVVVYAGFYNSAGIFARDVDLMHDVDATPYGGQDNRSGNFAGHIGSASQPVDVIYRPSRNHGAKSPTPHAYPNAASDPEYVPTSSVPREQRSFNFGDYDSAVAPNDREYFYGSFDRDICGKSLTLFGDMKYMRSFWQWVGAPSPFNADPFTDVNNPNGISATGISVPLQNPFNPFTVADYVSPGGADPRFPQSRESAAPAGTAFTTRVRYRDLEAPPRGEHILGDNYIFTGGARGNLAAFGDYFKTWEWESAVRYNEDHRTDTFIGLINAYALRAALLDTNPATAFNPFSLSQNSKAALNRIFINTQMSGATRLLTEDLKLTGDIVDLPGGPLSFAFGGEHLNNHLTFFSDPLSAAGQTIGEFNIGSLRGGRDSWSIYWELRLPVTGPNWNLPGVRSLELDYAERFESYSDFGETERPKFSLRWQPFGGSPAPLTIRASYIEAFHAPSLVELFGTPFTIPTVVFDPRSSFTDHYVPGVFTGNPSLQPELAYERTFGAVLTPETWCSWLQGLTITVDYGHIDLRGFATQLQPQFIVDNESLFPGLITRDPGQGNRIVSIHSPYLNVGGFIENYIDFSVVETFQTSRLGHGDWGTFTATLNGTYLIDVKIQAVPDAPFENVVGKFGAGFQFGGNYTHNRDYLSLFYDGAADGWLHGLDAGVTVHYIGQYWDDRFYTNNLRDRKVREWTTLDLIINYTFSAPVPATSNSVAGLTKDRQSPGKETPAQSTADYNACGWRSWLNNTTLTVGMNNVFDEQPPFVAAGIGDNYDKGSANVKGRFWYLALTKRF